MGTTFEIDESRRSPLRRAALWLGRAISTVVYIYFIIVEIILLLGFFLLLLGANPTSGFVDWVYRSMDRAMEPFRGIFSVVELGQMPNEVESVFDTSVLFAMIVYGILVLVTSAVVDWLNRRAARFEMEDAEYRRQQVVEQSLEASRIDPLGTAPVTGSVPPAGGVPPVGATPPPAGAPPAGDAAAPGGPPLEPPTTS